MNLLRLDPPIPLLTPHGKGMAHVMIDYGFEHELMWVVFQRDTGEIWTWLNKEVRAIENITIGRKKAVTSDKSLDRTKE